MVDLPEPPSAGNNATPPRKAEAAIGEADAINLDATPDVNGAELAHPAAVRRAAPRLALVGPVSHVLVSRRVVDGR